MNLYTLNCILNLGSGIIIINDFVYHERNTVFGNTGSQTGVMNFALNLIKYWAQYIY